MASCREILFSGLRGVADKRLGRTDGRTDERTEGHKDHHTPPKLCLRGV